MDKIKGCIFRLKMMTYQKNIILFVIKSALIKKKDCDRESIYMKVFLKAKIKSHSDEVTDFCDRNFLRQS